MREGAIGFRLDNRDYVFKGIVSPRPCMVGAGLCSFIRDVMVEQLLCEEFKDVLINSDDQNIMFNGLDVLSADYEYRRYTDNINNIFSNSYSCRWAYIVNLDACMFEIYCGTNTSSNGMGRYARYDSGIIADVYESINFYGIDLIEEFPLKIIYDLPSEKLHPYFVSLEKSIYAFNDLKRIYAEKDRLGAGLVDVDGLSVISKI